MSKFFYQIRTGLIVKRKDVKGVRTGNIYGTHTIYFDCGYYEVKGFVSENEMNLALEEFSHL